MSESTLLDLRGVACPMNFVKTKLALEKLPQGTVLEVLLDAGEPISSVFESVAAEGHLVDEPRALPDGTFALKIEKIDAGCIDKTREN
jgi:TusA-related sulfurtransferase